jgi:hypothetical protein
MWFGTDARDAHPFVLGLMGWMLDRLDHTRRQKASDDLRTTLDAHDTGAGVCFESAAWLIQASLRRSLETHRDRLGSPSRKPAVGNSR